MGQVQIITDASAHISSDVVARLGIVVLPIEVRHGETKHLLRLGDKTPGLFELMAGGPADPIQATVSPATMMDAYHQASNHTDQILVITSSGKLSNIFEIARSQSRAFLGRCRIEIMDAQCTSWGLGLLVRAAGQAAREGTRLDDVVRLVRTMLPHIYVVLIADRLDYLEKWGRVDSAQATLGSILGIKPLLIFEDGDVIPLEKVRSQSMALEKLADFVIEFASVEEVVLLQSPRGNGAGDLRHELIDRMGQSRPDLTFPSIPFDAVLACHIGPDALGVVVYEGTQ